MDQALTPAEALVLLEPNADIGRAAAKVTFLSLLAQGVLRLERETGRILGTVTRLRLAKAPAQAQVHQAPAHVEAVLDAVRYSRSGTVADIARRLSKATGQYGQFITHMLRPLLIERGLLVQHSRQEQRRSMLLLKRTVTVYTYVPSEAGAAEQARVRAALEAAPDIRRALDEDPGRAAAMAAALGGLIVLVPALLPFLGQIGHAMALPAAAGLGGASEGQPLDLGWLDGIEGAMADADAAIDGALGAAESGGSDGDGGGSESGGE
jgi:hypothetical protein